MVDGVWSISVALTESISLFNPRFSVTSKKYVSRVNIGALSSTSVIFTVTVTMSDLEVGLLVSTATTWNDI